MCQFEHLELRQVLSATITSDPLTISRSNQTAGPTGFTAFQIQSAYGLYTGTQANFMAGNFNNNIKFGANTIGNGKGQTIAIVDAADDPSIIADTKAFSAAFGLPVFNTVAGGPTFKVVNQYGSSNISTLPLSDPNISVETSLDVEWAHAMAPDANIVLVESADILAGVNYARTIPGVSVVSLSYGFGFFSPVTNELAEFIGENAEDFIFTTPTGHQGVSFTVSAGDSGGPAQWPSTSPNVLSVGGTALTLTASNTYSNESVWNGNGSGGGGLSGVIYTQPLAGLTNFSSAQPVGLEPAPNYQVAYFQSLHQTPYTTRATPDVSFDADPNTGYSVYDSFAFGAATPWDVIGGTSAGAPAWAGLLAIVDQGRVLSGKTSLANAQTVVYKLPKTDFHDITVGNDDLLGRLNPTNTLFGLGITGNAATTGYDLASGLGTPIANLMIRDMVAFNGSTVVTAPRSTTSGSAATIAFLSKAKAKSNDSGSSGDGPSMAAADISDSASVAASDLDEISVDDGIADSATQTASLHYDDAALQFAGDSHDDGSNLSHHFHGLHDANADSSSATLDDYFASI